MDTAGRLMAVLVACLCAGEVLPQDPAPKFPRRTTGEMSEQLFQKSLAQSEQQLRDAMDAMKFSEQRYLAGGAAGLMSNIQQVLLLGQQTLKATQDLNALRAGQGARGSAGVDSSSCDMLQRYANQCKTSWESTQADAFKQCYEIYTQAYQQACAR